MIRKKGKKREKGKKGPVCLQFLKLFFVSKNNENKKNTENFFGSQLFLFWKTQRTQKTQNSKNKNSF